MSSLMIKHSLLALTQECNDATIEEHFAKTEKLLENEDMRRELTESIRAGVAAACKSKEAGDRILSILLHAFLLEPSAETAFCICHFIINYGFGLSSRNFGNVAKEELLEAASSILSEEISSDKTKHHINSYLDVARASLDHKNYDLYIPALVLAYHLQKKIHSQNEQACKNTINNGAGLLLEEVLDLLGRRIFALNTEYNPASKGDIYLLSRIIQDLNTVQLEQVVFKPFQIKFETDMCGSVKALCSVISILEKDRTTEFVNSHMKGPAGFINTFIRLILSDENPNNEQGYMLISSLMKASPLLTSKELIYSLNDILKESFEKHENSSERSLLYRALEAVAGTFLSREYYDFYIDENRSTEMLVEQIISTVSCSLEKEETEQNNEACISTASDAVDSWTSVLQLVSSQTVMENHNSLRLTATKSYQSTMALDDVIKSRSKIMVDSVPTADLLGVNNMKLDECIKTASKQLKSSVGVVFEKSVPAKILRGKKSIQTIDHISIDRTTTKSSSELMRNTRDDSIIDNNCNQLKNIHVSLKGHCNENKRGLLLAQETSLPNRSECKKDDDLVFDVEGNGLAKYTVTGQEGIIEASHGLVTATAVKDDKFDIPISYAQTFEAKIPFHRNKRVITYAIGFVLILIITATGASFAATKKVIDMGIITDIPSAAPSIPPTTSRDTLGIWERLSELSGPNILLARAGDTALQKTPQYKAAYWIINDDERRMDPNDDLLEQRYILALIYFATNGHSWKDCSFDSNLDECTYYDYGFQSNFTETRYLSGSHECDWFQTYCSNDKIVRDLHLYNNNLSGSIPSEVAALTKLRTLWLNANSLIGTLPTELGTLRHLASLEIHSNQIHGTLPSEIFNIDTLQSLNVAMNNFDGTVPDLFENLKNLKGIHMFENSFSGPIPASIGTMPYLSFVFLQGNELTGTIPSSLLSISRMRQLLLYENRLTGTLTAHIGQMKDLEILMLNDNNLEGTLPDELYELESLEWLYLQSNKFNGNIASDIGKLKNLKRLLFRLNDFTGTIPKEIGHLKKLEDLWLHFNKLEGNMPEQVCGLTDYGLGSLMADCLDEYDQAALDCECCTDCCDREQETCYQL